MKRKIILLQYFNIENDTNIVCFIFELTMHACTYIHTYICMPAFNK